MGKTKATEEELSARGARPKVRIDKLLREAASLDEEFSKEVVLRFLLNPVRFNPCGADKGTLGSVVCERTELEGEAGRQTAVGTQIFETIPANLVSTIDK